MVSKGGSMNWYTTGFQQTDMAAQESQNRQNTSNKLIRFYLKEKESRNIIFVDDVAFEIWEHNLKLNGKWGNFFTCIGKKNGCVLCNELENKPYYSSNFTVLNLDGWKDKKGQIRDKNQVQLLSAKADVGVIIKHQKELRPSKKLAGVQYNILRTSSDDYSTGSQFTFIKEFSVDQLLAKYKPLVYTEILKPLAPEQLKNIVEQFKGGGQGPASGPSTFGSDGVDDIPF